MPFDEPIATEIDGVRVWWTDVGGPCMGGIVFRTGRADESLRTAGISHIVEHLALAPMMYRGYDMNGHVDALTTNLYVNGTQDQVEAFLAEVCRHLSALPTDRLEQERRVIETEARSRTGSFAGSASARFGARGFGVTDWMELGVRHLGPEEIAAWAAERYTAAQASAWMTRPPSSALRFDLAPGMGLPIPTPTPLPGVVLPSHVHSVGQFLGCSYTATRSMPLLIATTILRDRAMSALRGERGLTYSVQRAEERIGALDVLVMLWLDATDEAMPEALTAFTELLQEVADGTFSDDDLTRAIASAMPWNATDPGRPAREAARKATASLFGREPTPWKGLAAQGDRLTVDRVAGALTEALSSAILVAPEGLEVPDRYAAHPAPPRHRSHVIGRLYVRWDGNAREEVVLGDRGVLTRSGDELTTMLFEDVEVALRGPDGTIWLIDGNGDDLMLAPNQLLHGRELAAEVGDRLRERIVDLGPDVEGWFELQTIVESHDAGALRVVWREIEILARERAADERVLAIAIGDVGGHRGLVVVTDRRQLHICADRAPTVFWLERDRITSVVTTTSLFGRSLVIMLTDGSVQIDRIRPRDTAGELELLLAPIEAPET
ncbi:MAG TPA: hypothetical protein VE032_07460 [Actinomycetota bacterium]|nr:hypothetical protein [Actinomycetota bacterium]